VTRLWAMAVSLWTTLRTTMGWRGRRLAWLLVSAIITVLVTFWGVNLVMSGSAHVFNVD
jgi:ABC-type transport system involved in cytochrome c biogenesis permease subunit